MIAFEDIPEKENVAIPTVESLGDLDDVFGEHGLLIRSAVKDRETGSIILVLYAHRYLCHFSVRMDAAPFLDGINAEIRKHNAGVTNASNHERVSAEDMEHVRRLHPSWFP